MDETDEKVDEIYGTLVMMVNIFKGSPQSALLVTMKHIILLKSYLPSRI